MLSYSAYKTKMNVLYKLNRRFSQSHKPLIVPKLRLMLILKLVCTFWEKSVLS